MSCANKPNTKHFSPNSKGMMRPEQVPLELKFEPTPRILWTIERTLLQAVVGTWSIFIEKHAPNEINQLHDLLDRLDHSVIDNPRLKEEVIENLQRWRNQHNSELPSHVILLGKSGVGKTHLYKQLAPEPFPDENEQLLSAPYVISHYARQGKSFSELQTEDTAIAYIRTQLFRQMYKILHDLQVENSLSTTIFWGILPHIVSRMGWAEIPENWQKIMGLTPIKPIFIELISSNSTLLKRNESEQSPRKKAARLEAESRALLINNALHSQKISILQIAV